LVYIPTCNEHIKLTLKIESKILNGFNNEFSLGSITFILHNVNVNSESQ